MRGIIVTLAIGLIGLGVSAQQVEVNALSEEEGLKIASYLRLVAPKGYSFKSLPTRKDNTATEYFPQMVQQIGWSCNQASSVGYVFTYEMNAMRDLPASNPDNRYPPFYVYNFLNKGTSDAGVSFFDSWEIIKTNGIPSVTEYGDDLSPSRWVSGYDIYYSGMKNRIQEVMNLYVGDEEGLQTLKGWVHDHLDGSPNGGIANIQIGSGYMPGNAVEIPAGEEEEGMSLIPYFHPVVGHAVTIVGWNDFVRYDFNGDGQYTNDVDINEDDIVDMKDWEVGAVLCVNTWGGFPRFYVPYRLLAMDSDDGGIWEGLATVVRTKKDYEPKLAVKASVSHTKRNQIRIVVGVAKSFAAEEPDYIMEFPMFNFTGGPMPMQGNDGEGGETLEFGLDITPLLNYIDPDIPAKFFLEVYHRQTYDQNGSGKINYFSIMDYGSGTLIEQASPDVNVAVRLRDVARAAVIYDPVSEPVEITSTSIPDANVGEGYTTILHAEGGTPPYKWSHMQDEYIAEQTDDEWEFPNGELILGIGGTSGIVIDLGYDFPFYGKEYNQVWVLREGGIIMGADSTGYPYSVDPRRFIYLNPGIYPFFTELEYVFNTDGVYRFDDYDGTTIAWDASMSFNTRDYDPRFGVKLFHDGRIQIGYVATNIKPDLKWIAGVSKGDMKSFTLPEINNSPIFNGNMEMTYTMNNWPEWLILSEGGALLGIAQDGDARFLLPIKVTDNAGLFNKKTLNLHIHGTSGTDLIAAESGLEIFPNPFTDRLNIKLKGISEGTVRFELYDVGGRKVLVEEVPAFAGMTTIDLSRLESRGSYFYQLSAGGEVFRGKVVKSK